MQADQYEKEVATESPMDLLVSKLIRPSCFIWRGSNKLSVCHSTGVDLAAPMG